MQGEEVAKPVLQVIVSTVPALLCQPLGGCMWGPECSLCREAEPGCSALILFYIAWAMP